MCVGYRMPHVDSMHMTSKKISCNGIPEQMGRVEYGCKVNTSII